MVCKNCGASVKEGQFTCSSCGSYLSKDSTVKTSNLEEGSSWGDNSDLYSHKPPVAIKEGWGWYMFMTWGLIPFWVISSITDAISYFRLSFLLGIINIAYIILGFSTHTNLKEFSEKGIYLLYAYLIMPMIMLLITCSVAISQAQKQIGIKVDIDIFDVLRQGKVAWSMILYGVLFIVNFIYFKNRKDEFQY